MAERFPLHSFVLKRIVGFWLSSIPAPSSDVKLEQLFLLANWFLCFHNCCFCILFWSFQVDFAPQGPLFQLPSLMGISVPSVVLYVASCDVRMRRCLWVMLVWIETWERFLIQADITTRSTQQANSISPCRADHRVLAIRLEFVNSWPPFWHLHEVNLLNALWRDLVIGVLAEWDTRVREIFHPFQTKMLAQLNAT
jgi:hypothetical protein